MISLVAPVAAPSLAVTVAHAETVSAIVIEGNQRVENDTILAYVQISPGQAVDSDKIDTSALPPSSNDSGADPVLPEGARHHLDDLYRLGRIGHVRGIHAKLTEMAAEHPANEAVALRAER